MNANPKQLVGSQSTQNMLWRGLQYLGLILFAVLLYNIDWAQTAKLLSTAHLGWILLAGLFNFLFMILKAVRWHALLGVQDISYNFWRALKVYQAGSFFSVITPGRVGDVVKVAYLKRDIDLPNRVGVASVIVDRLFDLFTLSATAVLIVLIRSTSEQILTSVVIFSVLLVIGTYILFSSKIIPSLIKHEVILEAHQALLSFRSAKLIYPTLLSLLAYSAIYLGSYALAIGLALPLSFIDCAYCIAVSSVVALLPLSVSGVGTRDVTMVVLFSTIGLETEQAVIFSVGYLLVNLFFANTLGAFFWFSDKPNKTYAKA